jgi:F-type H+-transporting ATPase subunit delta
LSIQTIARRYATALADVVIKNNEASEVQQELTVWDQMMQSNQSLLEVFRNPTIPYVQKSSVLNTLIEKANIRKTTANFLKVLLRNQRLGELHEVKKRFAEELDQRAGMITAQVKTARPTSPEQQSSLQMTLTQVTGKKVKLNFEVDESLIGGVVTHIGSTVYDGSVRNQLDQLKEKLIGKA